MVDATEANDRDADDWHLLLEVADEGAMGILFERHKDFVFRLACGFLGERELAEDVTQEVFLRLTRGRRRWSRRAKFTTWLYTMTRNTSHELRRGRQRQARLLDQAEALPRVLPAVDPSAPVELYRLLDRLPPRQREIVMLRYLEGMTTREAAVAAGCSQGTVKVHLHRALGQMRRLLVRDGR